MYDAQKVRWHVLELLAEKMRRSSPYARLSLVVSTTQLDISSSSFSVVVNNNDGQLSFGGIVMQQTQDELDGHDATASTSVDLQVNSKDPTEAKLYMTKNVVTPERSDEIGIPKTGGKASVNIQDDEKGFGTVTTVINLRVSTDKNGNPVLSSTVNTQLSTGNLSIRAFKPQINIPFLRPPNVDPKEIGVNTNVSSTGVYR